jgi:hypothetical protein
VQYIVQKLVMLASKSRTFQKFSQARGNRLGKTLHARGCNNARFFSKRFLIELITVSIYSNMETFKTFLAHYSVGAPKHKIVGPKLHKITESTHKSASPNWNFSDPIGK